MYLARRISVSVSTPAREVHSAWRISSTSLVTKYMFVAVCAMVTYLRNCRVFGIVYPTLSTRKQ